MLARRKFKGVVKNVMAANVSLRLKCVLHELLHSLARSTIKASY